MRTLLSAINPLRAIKWGAYIVICCMVWLMLNRHTLQEYFAARERNDHYAKDISRLKREQTDLQAELAALKEGGFSKEKALRERLRMVKPGEEILYIESPSATPKPRE